MKTYISSRIQKAVRKRKNKRFVLGLSIFLGILLIIGLTLMTKTLSYAAADDPGIVAVRLTAAQTGADPANDPDFETDTGTGTAVGRYLLAQENLKLRIQIGAASQLTEARASYKYTTVDHKGRYKQESNRGDSVKLQEDTRATVSGDSKVLLLSLPHGGIYRFDQVTFTLTYNSRNQAGQKQVITKTLADLVNDSAQVDLPDVLKTPGLDSLLLTSMNSDVSFNLQDGQGTDLGDDAWLAASQVKDARLVLTVKNDYFSWVEDFRNAWLDRGSVQVIRHSDETRKEAPLGSFTAEGNADEGLTYSYRLNQFQYQGRLFLADGPYTIELNDAGGIRSRLHLTIDTLRPQISVTVPDKSDGSLATGVAIGGKKEDILVVKNQPRITLTLQDKGRIDPQSLKITGTRQAAFNKKAEPVDLTPWLRQKNPSDGQDRDKTLTYELTLKDDGLYDLSDMYLQASDYAGNTLTTNKKGLALLSVASNVSYQSLLVTTQEAARELVPHVAILPADKQVGVRKTDDTTYYRGAVKEKISLKTRWLEVYKHIDSLKLTVQQQIKDNPLQTTAVPLSDLKVISSDSSDDPDLLIYERTVKEEGKYHIQAEFWGQISQKESFLIDTTAPAVTRLSLEPAGKVKGQWIFSSNPVTVTIEGVTDSTSGLEPASAVFASYNSIRGNKQAPLLHLASSPGSHNHQGSISFTVRGGNQRMTFAGTVLLISDEAGNQTLIKLSDFIKNDKGKSLYPSTVKEQEIKGIVIDSQAPRLSISYDNNAVHHGRYFSSARTATVTLIDPIFDLLKSADPSARVVTVTHDGTKQSVSADKFTPIPGHPGLWAAQVACRSDGQWEISASLVHPTGLSASAQSPLFIIDTVKPLASLTFNNNDSRSGNYYKANRIALIRISDRNINLAATHIVVTAKDQNGKVLPAPAASAWTVTSSPDSKEKIYSATVAFTQECHYTISLSSSDFADNSSQKLTEPEFIIDKTLPELTIGKVADKTAYADHIAPRILSTDKNLDSALTTYQLTASHHSGTMIFYPQVHRTSTSQEVIYGDFPHELKYDDLYTLTASAVDKAGNAVTRKLVFSVNRYGSVYSFDPVTQSMRGRYLKKARSVTITETNVSGLLKNSVRISLAKDSTLVTLKASQYSLKTSNDKGWSQTTYTLPASLFSSDGYYRIRLTSLDQAGNLAENTMSNKSADRKAAAEVNFAVDAHKPTVSALGIHQGKVYYAPSKAFTILAGDNMSTKSVNLYIDGKKVQTWSKRDFLSNQPTYTLKADGHRHTLTLAAVDQAGNKQTVSYRGVMIVSDWWQYAVNTPEVMNRLVTGAIFALALLAALLVLLAYRHKVNKNKRNPFHHSRK